MIISIARSFSKLSKNLRCSLFNQSKHFVIAKFQLFQIKFHLHRLKKSLRDLNQIFNLCVKLVFTQSKAFLIANLKSRVKFKFFKIELCSIDFIFARHRWNVFRNSYSIKNLSHRKLLRHDFYLYIRETFDHFQSMIASIIYLYKFCNRWLLLWNRHRKSHYLLKIRININELKIKKRFIENSYASIIKLLLCLNVKQKSIRSFSRRYSKVYFYNWAIN